MEHARHLSSPSPTQSFLFHHSERPYKSNSLTPLLSSAASVTSGDDCFSASAAPSSLQNHEHDSFEGTDHASLVSDLDNQTRHHQQNHHNHNHPHHHGDHVSDPHHHHHLHHHHHTSHDDVDQCVIDQDSLNAVDDDDGMHNMLSGSSTSSTSTLPLLNETHPHHSFSGISLGEYSPLSLGEEDCDNALPISPTSLACGSHHSFKSSLNGLKMDNLVDVGVHDHVDDVVNDAHSMSPSLLSVQANNNLWSNSSTAITQNSSLLNGTSTSFLLSHHHHHHQFNSLMQQLEPQSLDEPPPLINVGTANSVLDVDSACAHRPSSEPPPGSGVELSEIETQSIQATPAKLSKPQSTGNSSNSGNDSLKSDRSKLISSASLNLQPASNRSSRKSRRRSGTSLKQQTLNGDNPSRREKGVDPKVVPTVTREANHSSQIHLQLTHHKKLKELQQRLFGNTSDPDQILNAESNIDNVPTKAEISSNRTVSQKSDIVGVKEEADSSASSKEVASSTGATKSSASGNTASNQGRTRTRPSRSKKGRSTAKNDAPPDRLPSSIVPTSKTNHQKTVTEKAEPDTTTKGSDSMKLVDLLSNSSTVDSRCGNIGLVLKHSHNPDVPSEIPGDSVEKRIQQIQLQVSPSLTVVANGGLMQPINVQQQQQSQQQLNLSNGTVVGSSSFNNQILCRPQAVMTTAGNSSPIKSILMTSNITATNNCVDSLKNPNDAALISNWTLQAVSNTSQMNTSNTGNITTIANGPTTGPHQIGLQVICQDGTSLVLPVSAANLNAAVSLTSQHQQLQAVLANTGTNGTANFSQQLRNPNQMLPMLSVSNMVTQQPTNSFATDNGSIGTSSNLSQGSTGSVQHTSGLAASSPTLAALLDAGSSRNNNNTENNAGNSSSQNFISSNLLRKLVGGSSVGELGLQGAKINLTNNTSLVTVCTANNANLSTAQSIKNCCPSTTTSKEKRVKLENAEINNVQTTFTLIDPQGLIVANGNDKVCKQSVVRPKSSTSSNSTTLQQQNNRTSRTTNADNSSKQNKMASSTGNRQVDPTQPFRCEHCNSTFTRLGNFTRHKKIHTVPSKDGQRFKCEVCSKSFLQRCDLARHLHIHRGTEPHRCNICGKGYIRHSDLVTHQRFHNKEKPFGCPHCSKGFCQRGDLNRHLRSIHLQMKPILCPCCNRKFAKQETLLRHLNTAHRSKPGIAPTNAVIAEPPPKYSVSQGDEKQSTISVDGNGAMLNSSNMMQKTTSVASLQAIQATICKVQHSTEVSNVAEVRGVSANDEEPSTAKVVAS